MKIFSLDEANKLLPAVGAMVSELLQARRDAAVGLIELEALGHKPDAPGRRLSTLARDVSVLQERTIQLIEKIHALGCIVKDVDLGLVDFPAVILGETLNLCWKYGEPSIGYWHRLDEGFAHRKPLADLRM